MIVEGDTGMNTSISGLLLAAVLLVFSSSATWAGTVERQCGKMGPAYGADAYECTLKFSVKSSKGTRHSSRRLSGQARIMSHWFDLTHKAGTHLRR